MPLPIATPGGTLRLPEHDKDSGDIQTVSLVGAGIPANHEEGEKAPASVNMDKKDSSRALFPCIDSSVGNINYLNDKKLGVKEWLAKCDEIKLGELSFQEDSIPSLITSSDTRTLTPGYLIQPVTKKNLRQAQDLLKVIFPDETAHFEVTFSILQRPFLEHDLLCVVVKSEFWMVTDAVTGEAAAIVGASYYLHDCEDAIWGDWTGVSPNHRKRGLGILIFLFLLEKWISSGKKYARLYTEDVESEKQANDMYDFAGLKVYKREYLPTSKSYRIWRQADISCSLKNRMASIFLVYFMYSALKLRCILWWLSSDEFPYLPPRVRNFLYWVTTQMPAATRNLIATFKPFHGPISAHD